VPIRDFGVAADGAMLLARVTLKAHSFLYMLDESVPNAALQLEKARELFERERDDVRETLFATSPLLLPRVVSIMIEFMTRADVRPPWLPQCGDCGATQARVPDECVQRFVDEIALN
jgi:hypothetical protein